MPPTPPPPDVLSTLRAHASEAASRAYAPYSGRPVGAALLLSDGRWLPGVRLESASFPLTIPALLGGYVAAVAAGRRDVVAAALSRPFEPAEAIWFAAALGAEVAAEEEGALAFEAALPAVGARLDPFLPPPEGDEAGIAMARAAARRAHVPHSEFPVGCALVTAEGRALAAANVEHDDWTRGLCAERSALAVAAAFGAGTPERLFLTCLKAPGGTPCGACRQLLLEQAPEARLLIDQGEAPPSETPVAALLPHFFAGESLRL